jgi:hypothetical protein
MTAYLIGTIATTLCERCKCQILFSEAETCWYCLKSLCFECWDLHGHCGHPEAAEINERARQVNQQ